jgi:hypothetical protein
MTPEPNPLVVDAFKPVLDAVMEFALDDDARRDGEHYLGGPNPDERQRQVRQRAEVELLADYVESHVDVEPGMPERIRSLSAMTEIISSVSYLNDVLDVLRERCEGG